MGFGYQSLYSNGLNSNTQLRRSTDMVYQRGGTYEVVLTGTTYESSMLLSVDLYSDDELVGNMSIVPYDISQSGANYTYRFNIRPYSYLQNYVETEHYQYYWLNDWYSTTEQINWNNPYPNINKVNFQYGYFFISGGTPQYEFTGTTTTTNSSLFNLNDFNHFTDIPSCVSDTSFVPSGFTNTGNYFNYVGGAFQFDDNFILQNFDQEVGTVVGTGMTINTVDLYRRLSPMSQYLMDYPSVPEMSETSRFLTDSPRIQHIQSTENYVLFYLNGQTGDRMVIESDYAVFEFYDESNTIITSFNQELNFSGTTYQSPTGYTDTLKIFSLPCGPVDITNIFSTIDWTEVSYYTVQLYYSYPTNSVNRVTLGPQGPLSEIFYFYLYDNCLPENTRVCWLNNRGGYDYFTFRSYRQDTKKIKSQTYDSRYYATNISSPDRNIGRSVKTFATDVDQEIVLESEYINISIAQWLEQLFYSPQVYIMKPDFISTMDRQDKIYKDLQPVQILSTEVDTLTKKHKKLNKYKITLKTSNTFFVNKGF
jgi:hypothetical protein